jgi:hypothetical protein
MVHVRVTVAAKRKGIDVEMRALVRAMNRTGLGMRTIDSCFGHPGEDSLNHQSEAFVGFEAPIRNKLIKAD